MTQEEMVLNYMREFGGITPLDAMRDLGVMRLASRVSDLRKHGFAIEKKWVSVKNRWGDNCRVASYSEVKNEA